MQSAKNGTDHASVSAFNLAFFGDACCHVLTFTARAVISGTYGPPAVFVAARPPTTSLVACVSFCVIAEQLDGRLSFVLLMC